MASRLFISFLLFDLVFVQSKQRNTQPNEQNSRLNGMPPNSPPFQRFAVIASKP